MIPVKDHHALYRDEQSSAIVSTDMSEYDSYMKARKKKELDRAELDSLKDELREIKELLKLSLIHI